ncbi:MAG: aminopeptidase [Desulfobacterales bacterium]|nr:aminopeptidase [Desulfobacterales bacterium]
MIITEIFRNIWQPIKYNIKKGDNVVILTDPMVDSNIIKCLFSAVWAVEAYPTLIVIPTPRFYDELSASTASAIKEADLLVAATSKPVSRTKAVQSARNKGVRYLAMGGVTTETLLKGSITADFEELYQLTSKYADIINNGNTVHIISEVGTDLTFSIKGRKALALDGRMDEISKSAGIPSGEAACAPVEGTAEGIAVIDGGMHEIGVIQEPIVLKIKKGNVVEITGGVEANQLRELLETAGDSNSYNIGEFAFGTNPAASILHNVQEFKNKLGTVHLALGNNKNLFGNTFSKTHLDAIILKPTVLIDGKVVIDKGKPVS